MRQVTLQTRIADFVVDAKISSWSRADLPTLKCMRPMYARRWEHELYFRELKRQVRKTAVLQSHAVETAAQEIAALILVSALIADERARAAPHDIPVLRVSFAKVLDWVRASWLGRLEPKLNAFVDRCREGGSVFRRRPGSENGPSANSRRPPIQAIVSLR